MSIAVPREGSYLYNFYHGIKPREEVKEFNVSEITKAKETTARKITILKKQIEKLEEKNAELEKLEKVTEKTESDTKAIKASPKKEKEDAKAQLKPLSKEKEDKVTMQTRKVCPVKVLTKEEKKQMKQKVNTKIDNDEEHRIQHLVGYLTKNKVAFTNPQKMPTGLYEMNIVQPNGNNVLISVDINGLLYSDEIKFFLGRINVGEEYIKPAIMMTDESIRCLVNRQQIPNKFFVTEQLFTLNKVLDLQTLREKDPNKRATIFTKVANAITDQDVYNGILKAANGEAYRFAFSRYISEDEFTIVSSKRNLASNLGKEKLHVTKEIWINIKDKNVELTTKSSTK